MLPWGSAPAKKLKTTALVIHTLDLKNGIHRILVAALHERQSVEKAGKFACNFG